MTIDIKELTLQNITNNIVVIKNRVNVETIQKYKNNYNETININYEFPIPDKAAVYAFELTIDNEKYEAKVEQKQYALQIFQDASQNGDTASILTKHNNAFVFMISNIEKNKEFEIKIKYIYDIKALNHKYRLQIPTTLAPKYGQERITYLVNDKELAMHSANFNIKLYGISNINTVSDHDIETINNEEYIEVKALNVVPNRDFVLELEIEDNSYVLKANNGEEHYSYLNLEIPESEIEERQEALKYMFIMDRSGSMEGQKFEKAKNMLKLCLRNLDKTDKFNIMFFENKIDKFKEDYIYCDETGLTNADLYINTMETNGGTNIYDALKDCIYDEDLIILLFTDGQVWNTEDIYSLIQNKGKNTKLFCFGIDDAIDEDFVNKMAALGDGRSEFLNSFEDFYEKTIHQMISTFYKYEKVHIDLTDEELLLTTYPGDSISLIKNSSIKKINNFNNVKIIEDDSMFETLRIYYYYNKCRNKKLDNNLKIKYSKESNILTDKTTFVLIKQNEEKNKATKNIEISGQIPPNWKDYAFLMETGCFNSPVDLQNVKTAAVPDQLGAIYSKSRCVSVGSSRSNEKVTYSRRPLTKEEKERLLDEEELLQLFLEQRTDGSIDGYIDRTIKAVELYRKLGEPKMFKVQYKKALKFLKKNKIKI
jgi:hypothetical protein